MKFAHFQGYFTQAATPKTVSRLIGSPSAIAAAQVDERGRYSCRSAVTHLEDRNDRASSQLRRITPSIALLMSRADLALTTTASLSRVPTRLLT